MVSEILTVTNRAGFHMRLAGAFVSAMNDFPCAVTLLHKGREIDGKSIMSVMAACMQQGAEIEIQCAGPDEDAALKIAVALIRSGGESENE
ncbi:MAG TPA: HPr family phosphocarrier protein [Pseudoflavonifractor sp.]|nr:HPr family phosphocarrier protein [Pseudoflavonifractor sp.]